jgi:hypothetical protein
MTGQSKNDHLLESGARYNSWQDFATDQAAGVNDAGWADIRQHGTFHHDTLAHRIAPR